MLLKLLYFLVFDPNPFLSFIFFPHSFFFSFFFTDLFSRKWKIRGNYENNIEMKKGTKTGKWKWLNLKLLVKIFAASRKQLKK